MSLAFHSRGRFAFLTKAGRADAFTTVCGWEWHDHRHAVRRQVLAEGDNVCTKCGAMSQGYSLVGRLRGGVPFGVVTGQVGCGTVTC